LAKYLSAAVITTKTQAVALVAGKSGERVAVADIEAHHPVDNGRLSSFMLIAVPQDAKPARCWLRAIRRARLRFG
jgi:predicted transcriptional regulator